MIPENMTDTQKYAGCNHLIGPGIHVAISNPTVKLRDDRGRVWYLEWHHYFGPIACTKRGDPRASQPGEKSRFWPIATLWHHQGCRVDDSGWAVWEMPPIVAMGQVKDAEGNVYEDWGYEGCPFLGREMRRIKKGGEA